MTIKKNPGEVAAISGYDFQYKIFATEIYNCLLNYEIEWVEFASADTGKLDDVLIGLNNRIMAYQVKEISSSKFSYSQFTSSGTESILQGAFKGWKKLKEKYPGVPVDARFITTQSISEHDLVTTARGKQKPSFKKFIENCWLPLQSGKYTLKNLPATWVPVIDELASFVAAKPEEFIQFITDFIFVFDYKPDNCMLDSYTQSKRNNDIDKITKSIFRLVAQKGNIKYTKPQLVAEFGLKNQLETHFQHSFFIDDKHYQPILTTINILQEILSRKSGGYLALIGNAGSGKSTLLTKWISDGDYKVLKYYAYTNVEMNYDFGYRGEAELFLHDLLIQIRESKLSLQDRLPEDDLLSLQKHFHEELKKLSHCGQKVFIIVDGLDHIDREQKVNKSLIEVLPTPESIPDNIYIILGSRTIDQLENLNFEITEDLKESGSIISISPLSKEHVLKLVQTYSIELSSNNFDMLCLNTKGHPLFLRYTLEELKSVTLDKYETIIKKSKFSGDIYKEYHKFWNKYRDYDEFTRLLGLISRFRFPYFDTGLLHLFNVKNADATRVRKVAEFYFYKSDNIWQFFHNSFKEFLIEQSAKDRFTNMQNKNADKEYHLEIADAIKNTDNEYRFNRLYHLHKAERHADVTTLTSQEYFRQQWFGFRDPNIIIEDIKLAALSCFYQKNLKILAACFFAAFELKQRTSNFYVRDQFKMFLQIGRMDIANSLVFNNARLLVNQSVALEYAILLFHASQTVLAKELFERATPIKLLSGSSSLSTRRYNQSDYTENNEVETVCLWAVAAIHFMPLTAVLSKLEGLEVENEEYDGTKKNVLAEGLSEIVKSCLTYEDWDKLSEIADIYDEQADAEETFFFYFELINAIEKGHALYARCIYFFDHWQIGQNNRINIRFLLIYTIFEKDLEKCSPVLAIVKKPSEFKKDLEIGSDNGFSTYIFNYSRLFYIITKDFSTLPVTFLPFQEKPAFNAFYLAFAELGKAYAWMFHDYKEASVGFFLCIDRVLGIFHYSSLDSLYEYKISSEKGVLVNSILGVSSRISSDIFGGVLDKISMEWQNFGHFWRSSEIQHVIEWVIESKMAPDWCSQELRSLDTHIFKSGYLDQRLQDGIKQVELWAMQGELQHGESIVSKIMSVALDVRGEKDSQLDYMVQWLSKFQEVDPLEVQFYFDRLSSVNDVVNSPSHTPADLLLRLSFKLGNGFNILSHLLFEGIIEFTDGLESIIAHLFKNCPSMRSVALNLFGRIILGFDNFHGTRHHFISEFFKSSPSIVEISALINEVEINAVMESRNDYLYDLQQQCLKINIDPQSVGIKQKIEQKKSGHYENIFRLKSGDSLTELQLLEKISSLEQIIEYESLAENHSYFKWHELVRKIIPVTSEKELEAYLFSRNIEPQYLTEIAITLIDKGKKILAQKILEHALSKSRATGWVTTYDGGSKIGPYEQLKHIENREIFQQKAFKDFAKSIIELDIHAMELLIKDLNKIWNLFSDKVDKTEIHGEMKLYRDELLKNHSLNEREISVTGEQTNTDLSIDVLDFLITFPSNFTEIVFPILIQEYQKINNIVQRLLARLYEEGFKWKFLQLLAGLSTVDSSIIDLHASRLLELLVHERFDIAVLAERLLDERGISYELPNQSASMEVPLSYTFELSPKSGITDANRKPVERIDENGFLKDTEDPLLYTHIFKGEVIRLAQITGFNKYNIAYRIMLLSQNPEFPEWCAQLSEEALRAQYDRFRLKISYKRPQVQKVIAGFNQVVSELLKLGLIDQETAEDITGSFDERIYLMNIVKRPEYVPSILSEHGSAPSTDAKWAKDIDKAYLRKVLKFDAGEYFVLAEHTTLAAKGHGRAVEVRQSSFDLHNSIDNQTNRIFYRMYNCLIKEYPYQKRPGIILYNAFATVNSKELWLAINPGLALDMGLTLNENEDCFRWDDKDGKMVVKSIFWQDGNIANQNAHYDSEAAEGWMVVITRDGMKKLLNLVKGMRLFIHRKVERDMVFVQRRFNTNIKGEGTEFDTEEVEVIV